MSQISATAVKALRDRTDMPMMDCKKALTESNGDMDKAVEWLRKQGKMQGEKRADKETAEGRVAAYVDNAANLGALIELRCESAPVTKSDQFIKLANDIVKQVAVKGGTTVEEVLAQKFVDDASKTINDRIADVVGLIRENMKLARLVRVQGLCGSYVHHDGSVGVLLQVEGAQADAQLLRDICMHITARNPVAGSREEVPAATIEKERDIARTQAAATGKPANIVEKIAEGKLATWFAENVLLEQPFVKDDSKKVGDLLKAAGLKFVKFYRYRVGQSS